MTIPGELIGIFEEALRVCAPDRLVRSALRSGLLPASGPVTVVALGKCAGLMFDGAASELPIRRAFICVPAGYLKPGTCGSGIEVVEGSHPEMSKASFEAGRRLVSFMNQRDDDAFLFLVSGGSSASIEVTRDGFTDDDVARVNRLLLASGLPIAEINTVRRALSKIKGGRLAAMTNRPSWTLLYSDVAAGQLADIGSGPTLSSFAGEENASRLLERLGDEAEAMSARLRTMDAPPMREADGTACLLADNGTLVHAAATIAAARGWNVVTEDEQIETPVDAAAERLVSMSARLGPRSMLVAGGEPTVRVQGDGRGGRCSELAVRFATRAANARITGVSALFAGSDGLDGNSGVAGFVVTTDAAASLDRAEIEAFLARSDSFSIASRMGHPVEVATTGNNLRDLFLLARG